MMQNYHGSEHTVLSYTSVSSAYNASHKWFSFESFG